MTAPKLEKKKKERTRDPEGSIIEVRKERVLPNGKKTTVIKFHVRKQYKDRFGKQREKVRVADTYSDALTVRRALHKEIEEELTGKKKEQSIKTFSDLCDYFEENYLKPAEYEGNQKVAGYRSPLKIMERAISHFRKFFQTINLHDLTYADLKEYKKRRLNAPVVRIRKEKVRGEDGKYLKDQDGKYIQEEIKTETKRKYATVHRELAYLRRMLNVAVQQGFIQHNPFNDGDALIVASLETERERILTRDEEKLLLSKCTDKREHLKAILIFALDTAMRRGEIFKLRWKDVDLERRVINVLALNTKTMKPRKVPVTQRVYEELTKLRHETFEGRENDLVFGILTSPKKAFAGVLEDAEIEGIRFHDLRGTAITRMLRAGIPASEVMKISGHTQFKTFLRYIKTDEQRTVEVGSMLDKFLTETDEKT